VFISELEQKSRRSGVRAAVAAVAAVAAAREAGQGARDVKRVEMAADDGSRRFVSPGLRH